MGRAVVVPQSTRDALAHDIVGLTGREPGDVCVAIVIGVHSSFEVTVLDARRLARPPCRHDTSGRLVIAYGVVIDGFEWNAVAGDALDEPIGLPLVDPPSTVPFADCPLDV